MTHRHNADPAKGAVCSHRVTDEMLLAWGIVTERNERTMMAHDIPTRAGIPRREGVMVAWQRGLVRHCTLHPTGPTPPTPPTAGWVAEATAWVAAHRRTMADQKALEAAARARRV
jgi:hypothetical protein